MEPVTTGQIYWGAVPFVVIQCIMVGLVILFPQMVMHYKSSATTIDPTAVQQKLDNLLIPGFDSPGGGVPGLPGFDPPGGGAPNLPGLEPPGGGAPPALPGLEPPGGGAPPALPGLEPPPRIQ